MNCHSWHEMNFIKKIHNICKTVKSCMKNKKGGLFVFLTFKSLKHLKFYLKQGMHYAGK